MSLQGKIVIVTGASRGIGEAIALRLAREGARLALCGRDREALNGVAAEVAKLAATPAFTKCFDLADGQETVTFYRETREQLGVPDIVINNAGFNPRKAPIWEIELEELDSILAVNLRAPFLLMREAFPDMKARGSGHVVNVLSTVCHSDMETMGAYTAAKNGLQALTRIFRKEVRPHGIRVTAIYPGGTDTEFRPKRRPDYMRPESVADAIHAALTLPEDLVVHELTFRPMVETNF